ncbi:hypothetical protein CDD83_8606 [Cordyceps sp. RAO-2017]|nr:hypothetical protein CDD83_8606 [Cordyceps sp. RAO-2017]
MLVLCAASLDVARGKRRLDDRTMILNLLGLGDSLPFIFRLDGHRVPTTDLAVPSAVVVAAALVLAVCGFYAVASPRPLPGIPRRRRIVLADAIEALLARDVPRWMVDRTARSGSDMVQISPMGPLGRPVVVLANDAEARSILLRRGADFDVAGLHGDIFRGLMPRAAIARPTDAEHRRIRRLTRDLMAPDFLSNVSAPKIYAEVGHVVDAWRAKAGLARGRPWDAAPDIERLALGVGCSLMFGGGGRDGEGTAGLVRRGPEPPLPEHGGSESAGLGDGPAVFRPAPLPEVYAACRYHSRALLDAARGAPRLYYFVAGFLPRWKRARAAVDAFVGARAEALSGDAGDDGTESYPTSHLEAVLRRASSDGRGADPGTAKDEVYSHFLGFQDTVPHVISWAVVCLGIYQDVQRQLRDRLRAVHARAGAEGRAPAVAEIVDGSCPLLDAFVHEVLRCRPPISSSSPRSGRA